MVGSMPKIQLAGVGCGGQGLIRLVAAYYDESEDL